MKQLHKRLLVGWMAVTLLTVSVPTHSFFMFNVTDLHKVSLRIACATRSAMSSLRNFLIPVRVTVTARLSHMQPSKVGETVANFASTAADKIGDAYKHAQEAKASLKVKAERAHDRFKKASLWQRLIVNKFFGSDVELG